METKLKVKSVFTLTRPNAAGIDISSNMHYVAIPADRDEQCVRKFGSFTQDLHDMAHWLKLCKIDTVAMESTGVYWIQPFLVLEEYGFEVFLVNARHIKQDAILKIIEFLHFSYYLIQGHTVGCFNAF